MSEGRMLYNRYYIYMCTYTNRRQINSSRMTYMTGCGNLIFRIAKQDVKILFPDFKRKY